MRCPMHVKMPFVYELLEKKYKRIVSMYDLRKTLVDSYGPINQIENCALGGFHSSFFFFHLNVAIS